MDTITISKIYSKYTHFYDYLFGRILAQGRYKAIQLMNPQPGEKILEVGIGTGVSLPSYPRYSRVVGIDICWEMLEKARRIKLSLGLSNVSLYRMDAERLAFANGRFDKVIAAYVITVVPNSARAIMEMKRVCKKEGEIFVLNYFGSKDGVLSNAISSIREKLGLGKPLNPEKILEDANLKILEIHRVNFLNLFHLIRCKNA
ncbi:MAG TPA: class I SAM-dependent methyltransferase [Candidatus Brocadiia bacterium]|nr:class I SAM-dependent methyltransferase [Planctomycetota bacterium]MDO8091932.1 class I SAM-dependent methyltransferase [Candidatus Brocadiales bacterium]